MLTAFKCPFFVRACDIFFLMQAICESYDCKVDNFASMVDGRAMWCLLDYYFRKDNRSSYSYKVSSGVYHKLVILISYFYSASIRVV